MGRGSRAFVLALALLAPAPAFAAIDMGGYYAPVFHEDELERRPGPEEGDFTGLPINDAARSRGSVWNSSLMTMVERQCIPNGPPTARAASGIDSTAAEERHDT